MRLHVLCLALYGLALFSRTAHCQDDEDEGYGGGGDDEEGYGGGGGYGGDEEEASPPPSGDAKELTSVEDFDIFLDNNDASVVAAFLAKEMPDPNAVKPDEWDDEEDGEWSPETIENPALTAFNSITADTYGYRWAYTATPEVLAKLKVKSEGLYLFRSPRFVSKEHGDRPRERFPSSTLSQSAVSNWLASKAAPLVGLFSSDTKERYIGGAVRGAKPAVVVIFMNLDREKNAKGVQYVLKRARKVAAARKGKISFAVANMGDSKYDMEDYGLESKSTADIRMGILHRTLAKDDFYGTTTDFSEKSLTAFADSFLAGELTPHVKPDPPDYSADDSEGDEEGGEDEDGDDEDGDDEGDKEEI
jgi:hypothetical protein